MVYCKFLSKVRSTVFQFCLARVILTQCLSCLLERSCKAALSMGSLTLMVFFGALGINAGEQKFSQVQLKLDLGLTNEADLLLNRLSVEQTSPSFHYYKGRVASIRMQNKNSVEHYKKAIELDPTHAKSYAAMALVKGRMGDFKSALSYLDRAISIDPGYAKAYSNRGVTRGALQQNQAAINDFTQAIRLEPRLADAYRNRGITKEMLGNLNGACADWKIASALGQEGPKQWAKAQCK